MKGRVHPRVVTVLAMVVLGPLLAMGAVIGSSARLRWSDRKSSAHVWHDSAVLTALIDARVAVTQETIQSEAVAAALSDGLNLPELTKLIGIDLMAQLKSARDAVDVSPALEAYPLLRSDLAVLRGLRGDVDRGLVLFSDLDAVTTSFAADIDRTWRDLIFELEGDVTKDMRGGGFIEQRLGVVESAFSMYSTALEEVRFSNNLAGAASTAVDLRQLIAMAGTFAAAKSHMSTGLGPLTQTAWDQAQRNPAAVRFQAVIDQIVQAGLAGHHPAYAGTVKDFAASFKDSLTWAADLAAMLRAASLDVRAVAGHNRDVAYHAFVEEVGSVALIILLALIATVLLARSLVRPLRNLSDAAHKISAGQFKLPAVGLRGPREVARTGSALNELTATLTALEAYTQTLATDPFSSDLDTALPGHVGEALQTTLDRLRETMQSSEQHRLSLQDLATHDSLTGLLNRGAALEAIDRDLSRLERDGGEQLVVLFVDLDGLKSINDQYGHEAGDGAIQLMADALRATTRQSDVVARLGGDEFLVASFAGAAGPALASRIVHELRSRRLLSHPDDESPIPVRCSIGLALAGPGDTAQSLIGRADDALYQVKDRGGDGLSTSTAVAARTFE